MCSVVGSVVWCGSIAHLLNKKRREIRVLEKTQTQAKKIILNSIHRAIIMIIIIITIIVIMIIITRY